MSKPIKVFDQGPSNKKNKAQKLLAAPVVDSPQSSHRLDSLVGNKRPATPHPLERILGPEVKHSSGSTVSPKTFSIENGVIGLYFAAHWCPPCRMLTSQLALLYHELNKTEKKLEVVYISFDYSEESFTQYFSNMPWHAVDYKEVDKREELAEIFLITKIPVLIFLDANSFEIISREGREILNRDPMGMMFPWQGQLQTSRISFGKPEISSKVSLPEELHKSQNISAKTIENEQENIQDEDIPAVLEK